MTCLNDAVIQAIVDNEAPAEARAHAASCEVCAARIRERQMRCARLASTLEMSTAMPAAVERRVERALVDAPSARGATRLRTADTPGRGWRRTGWSAVAVAAATLVAVLFVAPMVKSPATVSAAEILAKSANRLAQTATSGIELLEYELVLDGVPRDMMPDHANGTYRIAQAIDHDAPGRFRYASYGPDGRLLSSIAQDPAARRRITVIRVDDQFYRFEFALPSTDIPSLPEIERLHMQATVAMMQASGQQLLQVVDGGKQYRIEVPEISATNTNAMWDLNHARVLIDAEDFRIKEFTASGTFLKQPYSVSYKLISQVVATTVQPDVFEVPVQAGAIVIAGQGTPNPAGDAFLGALRELAKQRQAR